MKTWLSQNKTKLFLLAVAVLVGYWFGQKSVRPIPLRVPMTSPVRELGPNIGEKMTLEEASVETGESEESGSPSEHLVIKTATLSLLVKEVRQSVEKMQKLATDFGGFVVDSSITVVDEKKEHLRGTVTIRVPDEKFDEALKTLKDNALKVESEQTSGQDVTEEYTDSQSRLRNLEATEAQLLKIMERAGEIKDVLAVQQELTRIREQIETTKGRIKFLEESAALSSITAYFATEEEELPIVEERWRPLATIKSALRSLISVSQALADKLLYVLVFFSPIIAIVLVVWFLKKFRREPQPK